MWFRVKRRTQFFAFVLLSSLAAPAPIAAAPLALNRFRQIVSFPRFTIPKEKFPFLHLVPIDESEDVAPSVMARRMKLENGFLDPNDPLKSRLAKDGKREDQKMKAQGKFDPTPTFSTNANSLSKKWFIAEATKRGYTITKGDVKVATIGGEKYYTFQPNTIVYAVPVNSKLGAQIKRASVGVVWHTTYEGREISKMKASFGKNITNKMRAANSVWMDDATYRDVSGNATFTAKETDQVTALLSQAGKRFNTIDGDALVVINEVWRSISPGFVTLSL